MFNIKDLTKRIRNKKLKGNISLLVILVLLATSVITLLSINQIMRLISYWNQTFNYFRAYYIAKAWTELWLAEVNNRGDGFNNRIESGSSIISWNLLEEYSAFNPYFDTTITWSFIYLTNDVRESNECNTWNTIRLGTGEWIMLSLFSDTTTGTKKILSGWTDSDNISQFDNNKIKKIKLETTQHSSDPSKLTFAFFTYEEITEGWFNDYAMGDIIVKTDKSTNNLNDFLNDDAESLMNNNSKKYLTIKNSGTWNEVYEFCVTTENESLIPYSNSLITTIWHYGDTEVGIQSIVKKWVPDWTLNVIDKTSWS